MRRRASRVFRIHQDLRGAAPGDELAQAADLGFDSVLAGASPAPPDQFVEPDLQRLEACAAQCRARKLDALMELRLDRLSAQAAIVAERPTWFRGSEYARDTAIDPRQPIAASRVVARLDFAAAGAGIGDWYAQRLAAALDCGIAGFAVHWPHCLPSGFTAALLAAVRARHADAVFIAWTPGATPAQRQALQQTGYDASVCSLAWWDYRAPWFAAELADLQRIGRVLAAVQPAAEADGERMQRALQRALEVACALADGVVFCAPALRPAWAGALRAANRTLARRRKSASPRPLGAPWARVGAWLGESGLVLVNSDLDHHQPVPAAALAENAGSDAARMALPATLGPAEVRCVPLPERADSEPSRPGMTLEQALASPRVAVERIAPVIDDGRFAARRTVGERVAVTCDAFADGHAALAVHLLWRRDGEPAWQRTRMKALGNDRWGAEFRVEQLGRYRFAIETGIDEFASLRRDLEKKRLAGQATALDAAEGRLLIEKTARRAPQALAARLHALAGEVANAADPLERLLAPDCAELMSQLPPAFAAQGKPYPVTVERRAARYAAWYELFPRSQGRDGRHGTFKDVIAQLPRIAAMGFDVLYFPPIHPIGVSNRKGANNALSARPGEPGSAYAIGSDAGGHDAVHPQLGTLADFRKLVAAAAAHGIELALDFAIQCSPDHPWIREHPEWFDWRPDGSLKHAENPPKKYEDIVNVDFYAASNAEGLWRALRDVVVFWLRQGVRIFRVDNPHTKPLPFWEWLIAEVRAVDAGAIFLSEAFTRPKPMYRLAKVGYSQSYTYFTWRNTREELESYLGELNAEPQRDFFRPHFFVNTPDINPYFLQSSGRAGFLIRAALAATLSGLWGVYSGFELCEAAPLPGREEYLDSEKYQLRERDWNAPGNIVAEIAALNRIRRANPALHSHLGLTFYACSNRQVLYFAKATPTRDNMVLVAVCLDPHQAQEASIELPLWEFGLGDDGALLAEDLLRGDEFVWRGKQQHLRLDPALAPYRLWRLRREESVA
jgi:starch synthase (maltosyl-transferring)